MQQVQQVMGRLGVAIGDAGTKRVAWEQAKTTGSGNLFVLAQAHREAEANVAKITQEAIEAFAQHLRTTSP